MGRMFFVLCVPTWNHESNQVCMQYPSLRISMQIKIRHNDHTCVSKALVTALHTSRRYFSRYLGKRVAKEDSSVKAPALLSEA